MACLCNTALFDSGLRFIHNGVTIENVPNAYTVAMAMVLLNTNQEATDTAASNSLVTLRKDRGLPISAYSNGIQNLVGGDAGRAEANGSSLTHVVKAPAGAGRMLMPSAEAARGVARTTVVHLAIWLGTPSMRHVDGSGCLPSSLGQAHSAPNFRLDAGIRRH